MTCSILNYYLAISKYITFSQVWHYCTLDIWRQYIQGKKKIKKMQPTICNIFKMQWDKMPSGKMCWFYINVFSFMTLYIQLSFSLINSYSVPHRNIVKGLWGNIGSGHSSWSLCKNFCHCVSENFNTIVI